MTWRTIWTPSGSYFPAHCDHATEDEANRHALTMSRLLNDEVAVVPLTNQGDE